jgi:hypothetical protein
MKVKELFVLLVSTLLTVALLPDCTAVPSTAGRISLDEGIAGY